MDQRRSRVRYGIDSEDLTIWRLPRTDSGSKVQSKRLLDIFGKYIVFSTGVKRGGWKPGNGKEPQDFFFYCTSNIDSVPNNTNITYTLFPSSHPSIPPSLHFTNWLA